jgi:PAS domain S-box-containing protein
MEDELKKSNELLEHLVKERTKELQTSESKYRELVQNANSIIYRRDPQGHIIFFNEYAQTFFGYSEGEILGKHVVGTIVPERDSSDQDLAAMIRDISEHPDRYASNINENMRRNGERVWISWTNKAVRDEHGNVREILCVGNDISETLELQERLALSEKLYETVFETTGAGTVIIEDDMTLSLVNEEFARISGYPKEETRGRSWTEFVAEKDREMMMAYHRQRRVDPNVSPSTYRCSLIDRNGTEKVVIISVSMIPGTKRSVASFLDISKQVELHEKLIEQEKIYRLLADNVSDVIWTMDMNQHFTYLSPSAVNLFGYSVNEIPDILIEKILTTHSREIVLKLWKQFTEAVKSSDDQARLHDPRTVELELCRKDGSVISVETQMTYLPPSDKHPEAILGVTRDITKRRHAEYERWESEHRYHVLFDHSPMGIIHYNTELRIIDCNDAAAGIFGASREQIVDFDMKSIEDQTVMPALTAPLTGQEGGFEGPYRTTAAGKELWMSLRAAPLYHLDGSIDGGVALVEDVTDRIRAQKALEASKKELEMKTRSLEESNTALKVIFEQVEKSKEEIQWNVLYNVKELILPYLEKLKTCRTDNDRDACFEILETNLNNIISPFLRHITLTHYKLTPKELHVANLVKEGKTNKEIADLLHLSIRSVEFHRDNIRKKLGLKNKKANLQSFLLSLR